MSYLMKYIIINYILYKLREKILLINIIFISILITNYKNAFFLCYFNIRKIIILFTYNFQHLNLKSSNNFLKYQLKIIYVS